MVNYALIEAIMLRRCYIQKLAEHKEHLPEIDGNTDTLWGQVYALDWVLHLLDGQDNKLQWDFRDLTNEIYRIGEDSGRRIEERAKKKEGDSSE